MNSADRHPVHSLLWPQSVAVIGASPDVAKIRGRLLSFLISNAYQGHILPINPSHNKIMGLACYPSVAAAAENIGMPIDVVLIAIPADAVIAELERCAQAGVKHAVIITSGFAEQGGASVAIQQQIAALAQRSGMRINGPNGQGFYNAALNLAATFTSTLSNRPARTQRISAKKTGIIAQSGGVGFALFQHGRQIGLDFSYVVTTGNEVDLGLADYLEYMVEDEHTSVIFLYVETIRDPRRFERAALRALEIGKRIVAIKIGLSKSGQRATVSHTASMAGWDTAYAALFARCGVFQALDLEEALVIVSMLVSGPLPVGKRIAVVSASGGAGAWAGDSIERLGGSVPMLSSATQEAIQAMIPSYGGTSNPIDVTAQGFSTGAMLRIVDMLSESDQVDAVLVVTSLTVKHFKFDDAELAEIAGRQRKPLVFYSFSIPTEFALETLARAGITTTTNLAATCSALIKLAQPPPRGYVTRSTPPPPATPVQDMLASTEKILCEFEVKRILTCYGVVASQELLAKTEDEAVTAGSTLGYPIAMKVQSPLFPHKTETGGLRLNINSDEDVRSSYRALLEAIDPHADRSQILGILVQRMAPAGHEFIIGSVRDPTVGPLVLVGFGGVAAELYRDVSYRIAPVEPEGAREMLENLRSSVLLNGFRGQPRVDIDPIAQLIADVSRIAWELSGDIDEFELNPVIVHADNSGLTIVDGLMRKRQDPTEELVPHSRKTGATA